MEIPIKQKMNRLSEAIIFIWLIALGVIALAKKESSCDCHKNKSFEIRTQLATNSKNKNYANIKIIK